MLGIDSTLTRSSSMVHVETKQKVDKPQRTQPSKTHSPTKERTKRSSTSSSFKQGKPKRRLSYSKLLIYNSNHDPDEVFTYDPDLLYLRSHIKPVFFETFQEGVNKYISGDWTSAKDSLEKANTLMIGNDIIIHCKGDGPAQTLLKYIASYQYKAPKKWPGYRPLTSK